MGGCRRSGASPPLDDPLAQSTCRDYPARRVSSVCFASTPSCSRCAFALPLELVQPTCQHRLVGTTAPAYHGGGRSRSSSSQLIEEDSANCRSFFQNLVSPSEPIMRAINSCLLPALSDNLPLLLHCSFADISLRIPWADPLFIEITSTLSPQ
jgi:hypothetical protein